MKFSPAAVLLFIVLPVSFVAAQTDTTRVLDEVTVSAYQSNRPLKEIPATIGLVSEKDLSRFSTASLLPAVNTMAGVRMEERSPGSYRFAIRGSSLRSPFGVRNVKFYWNGLPMTDGGGNTYLNLIDFNAIGSMEVIKGPGASLYGAGTGGVVLLKSPEIKASQAQAGMAYGSYGLQHYSAAAQHHGTKADAAVRMAWQQADGYRTQSEVKRGTANADLRYYLGARNTLSATVFASMLHYQTPGGLTKAQYDEDAAQARPGAGTSLGAADQRAEVENKTGYVGLSHEVQWTGKLSTRTGMYGSLSDFDNPTIRNYESRKEKNGGLRTETSYTIGKDVWNAKFTAGAELQFFSSQVGVYGNDRGMRTQLQTMDDLTARQYLLFAQSEMELPYQFYVTLGASVNYLKYTDQQSITSFNLLSKRFDPEISPRIAVLKKVTPSLSLYGNISRGFSPPAFSEALPSTGVFYTNLNAEHGVSYEAGIRGRLFRQIDFDVAAYDFELRDAIVIQRADDGADYFVNAGSTSQKGLEAQLSWNTHFSGRLSALRIWSSATLTHYRFNQYEQSGADYSGNPVTGVPAGIIVSGLDLTMKSGLYLNATTTYTDHTSLNDAATDYAADYFLLGARIGYRKVAQRLPYEIFAGIDNALNQKYSLGNDLNAAGGRYYNVAPGRNFYAGFKITLK